jgi:hypothetical protein
MPPTPPEVSALLDAWERGSARSPAARALALLQAGAPSAGADLAALSVGARDAALLALRERLFGSRIPTVATCPACDAPLELELEAGELRMEGGADPRETLSLALDGHEIRFRVPTAADAVACAEAHDVDEARALLLGRCIVEARRGGEPVAPRALPASLTDAVEARMAAADPASDVEIALACPECGHAWAELLDVGSVLWAEVEAWARRLLRDVHALASAYGWSEEQILALGPARRRRYLELVGA